MQAIVADTPEMDASARGVAAEPLHPRTAHAAHPAGQGSSGATSTETRRVEVFASVKMMPFTGETSP